MHCFDIVVDFLYQHFPPGMLTVVLAVLAAVTALPRVAKKLDPERGTWWAHSAAILLFCLIAAGEMAVIKHADTINETHFQYLVTSFNTTDNLLTNHQAADRRLQEFLLATPKRSAVASLKERTLRLSADILAFLTNRNASKPFAPQRVMSQEDTEKEWGYEQETVSLFNQNFGAKVIGIHDDLMKEGISDVMVNTLYRNPSSSMMVSMLASQLGALAERLPN
jgi:hypothetical protein